MELILTGRQLSADEAYARGPIAALVEPGEADARALKLAATIDTNASLAVVESRAVIHTAIAENEPAA